MRWLPQRNRRLTGQQAEQRAEDYLVARGLRCLERNYHTRGGEIDLVMRDGHSVVFVEVRFRQDQLHGSAAETVTPHKQRRVRLAAARFLQEHPELAERPCRFDVIGMQPDPAGGRVTIQWIQDAFC